MNINKNLFLIKIYLLSNSSTISYLCQDKTLKISDLEYNTCTQKLASKMKIYMIVMLFKLGNTVHVTTQTITIQTVQILQIKASNLRVFYKQHVPYQHPNFKTIIYSCFMCSIGLKKIEKNIRLKRTNPISNEKQTFQLFTINFFIIYGSIWVHLDPFR